MNLAITRSLRFRVRVQVGLLPLQPPAQPAKVEPAAGVAVRVTTPFRVSMAKQARPQSMAGGSLVTLPEPGPMFSTTRSTGGGGGLNRAVTVWLLLISTVQSPVPLHAPLQPANVDVAEGTAVSVIHVSFSTSIEQLRVRQSTPASGLTTAPEPRPALRMERRTFRAGGIGGVGVNTALTDLSPSIVSVAGLLLPLRSPVQ